MLNDSQDTDYYRKSFQSGEKNIYGIEEYSCETEFCVTESVKM
jgi:hypothetical protein